MIQEKAQIIERKDLPKWFKEWMHLESHHHHPIVKQPDGEYYWEELENSFELKNDCGGFDKLVPLLEALGQDRNSEFFRHLCRSIGYSLNGYWEIVHCETNNDNAEGYVQKLEISFDDFKLLPNRITELYKFIESIAKADINGIDINLLQQEAKQLTTPKL